MTLPVEVRKYLDVHQGHKVAIKVDNGTVTIEGRLPTLDELAGSIELDLGKKDLEEVIREAKEEHYTRRWKRKMQS